MRDLKDQLLEHLITDKFIQQESLEETALDNLKDKVVDDFDRLIKEQPTSVKPLEDLIGNLIKPLVEPLAKRIKASFKAIIKRLKEQGVHPVSGVYKSKSFRPV